VATESGRYDRAEAIVGIAMAVLGLYAAHLAAGMAVAAASPWDIASASLRWQLVGVVGGFVAGNVLGSYLHPLRRVAVREREMAEEVSRAAAHVFWRRRLSRSRARAGVLVYLSLFERRMVVLADERAHRILGQEGLDAIRDVGIGRLRVAERSGALTAAVAAAADRLAPELPADDGDADELANELLVYHPRP
jgi:putative membrane protein